jgi:hypothetical protein
VIASERVATELVQASTREDGTFEMLVLPSDRGDVEITCASADHCRMRGAIVPAQYAGGREVEILLPRAVAFTGVVRDRDGAPVEGAVVRASRSYEGRAANAASTATRGINRALSTRNARTTSAAGTGSKWSGSWRICA